MPRAVLPKWPPSGPWQCCVSAIHVQAMFRFTVGRMPPPQLWVMFWHLTIKHVLLGALVSVYLETSSPILVLCQHLPPAAPGSLSTAHPALCPSWLAVWTAESGFQTLWLVLPGRRIMEGRRGKRWEHFFPYLSSVCLQLEQSSTEGSCPAALSHPFCSSAQHHLPPLLFSLWVPTALPLLHSRSFDIS